MTETKGIVLRKVDILSGKQMLEIFTREQGKISSAVFAKRSAKGSMKLEYRPLSLGNYYISKKGAYWKIHESEIIRDHFNLSSDFDKFKSACFCVELSSKLLPEEAKAPELFDLLEEYLRVLEEKKRGYILLEIAFTVKALELYGQAPLFSECVICGSTDNLKSLSVEMGGAICENCKAVNTLNGLIYSEKIDIINMLSFMTLRPLNAMKDLYMENVAEKQVKNYIRQHLAVHLKIYELKSDLDE